MDVFELMATGMTQKQVLNEHPEADDIMACLLDEAR
jgi:uncharacterized protein (DUF433 family)